MSRGIVALTIGLVLSGASSCSEPAANAHDPGDPDASDATESDATESDATASDATESDADAEPTDASSPDASTPDAGTPDVTGAVQIVGTPDYSDGSDAPFARNPWDMIAYGGRIYVGAGNSDNGGSPNGNAGPVKIVSFVPGQTTFLTEGASGKANLPEEQIDVFRVAKGSLWTCGHDPKLGWDIRTFYQRDTNGSWTQIQSKFAGQDGWGVHCYDMIEFGGELFSAGYLMGRSTDGTTWTIVGAMQPRRHTLLTVGGRLFALGLIDDAAPNGFKEWKPATSSFDVRQDLTGAKVFPGATWWTAGTVGKIVRPITVGAKTLYLGGRPASDHQTATHDVFVSDSWASGAIDVTRTTPTGERAWDLLARSSTAYLLTSFKTGTATSEVFRVTVWKANASLTGWTALFTISDLTTFARSFEEVNGDFYLGLGTDDGQGPSSEYPDPSYTTGVKADSGRILRVPSNAY